MLTWLLIFKIIKYNRYFNVNNTYELDYFKQKSTLGVFNTLCNKNSKYVELRQLYSVVYFKSLTYC